MSWRSSRPCPAGMRGHPVDTTTALNVEGAQGTTLYRCRGAGRFWSVVHCQHRGAEIVAMHTVPANLSLAQQILFARHREALARPARAAAPKFIEVPATAQLLRQLQAGGYTLYLRHGPTNNSVADRVPAVRLAA